MTFENQLFVIIGYGILIWLCNFLILISIVETKLNKKEWIKNYKNENIICKILFLKCKNVIPKFYLLSYYIFLLSHLFILLLCIYLRIFNYNSNIGMDVVKTIFDIDTIYIIILKLVEKYK